MNVVKDLLDRTSISQKELAVEIGVSQPTVSDWIHNKKDPRGKNLQWLEIWLKDYQGHNATRTVIPRALG